MRLFLAFLYVLILGTIMSCKFGDVSSDNGSDILALECAIIESPAPERMEVLKTKFEVASDEVMVIAHRASWKHAPENSLCAIAASIETEVDMIEIDVLQTKDGVLVLMHDDTLGRTTNGTGHVKNSTYDYIRSLHLKNRAGGPEAALTDQRVPTLREALRLAKDNVMINLDMKADVYEEAQQLLAELEMEDQVLMKMAAKPDDPRLQNTGFWGGSYFMPIVREDFGESLSQLVQGYEKLKPEAIEVVYQNNAFLNEGIESARKTGIRIWVNTLAPTHAAGHTDEKSLTDPDSHWGFLIDSGVSMIQTDEPEALKEYLQHRKLAN